jgi:hypothetical protein
MPSGIQSITVEADPRDADIVEDTGTAEAAATTAAEAAAAADAAASNATTDVTIAADDDDDDDEMSVGAIIGIVVGVVAFSGIVFVAFHTAWQKKSGGKQRDDDDSRMPPNSAYAGYGDDSHREGLLHSNMRSRSRY